MRARTGVADFPDGYGARNGAESSKFRGIDSTDEMTADIDVHVDMRRHAKQAVAGAIIAWEQGS
jgi:hypothetical protein